MRTRTYFLTFASRIEKCRSLYLSLETPTRLKIKHFEGVIPTYRRIETRHTVCLSISATLVTDGSIVSPYVKKSTDCALIFSLSFAVVRELSLADSHIVCARRIVPRRKLNFHDDPSLRSTQVRIKLYRETRYRASRTHDVAPLKN